MSAKVQQQVNEAILALVKGNSDAAWHILTRITFQPLTDNQLALATQEILREARKLELDDSIRPVKDIVRKISNGTWA